MVMDREEPAAAAAAVRVRRLQVQLLLLLLLPVPHLLPGCGGELCRRQRGHRGRHVGGGRVWNLARFLCTLIRMWIVFGLLSGKG